MNYKNRGQASIGTILIFIAIIFTVTLAAGVLIQTTMDLQSKAFSAASKAKESVATTLRVRNIFGEDGTSSTLDSIYLDIQIASGSTAIKLDQLGFKLDSTTNSMPYTYGNNVATCMATKPALNQFDVQYILESQNHISGYIQQGDIVRLCLSSFDILENQRLLLTLSPKNGQITRIEFLTPGVFESKSVSLYP